jgi:hypothetical protein
MSIATTHTSISRELTPQPTDPSSNVVYFSPTTLCNHPQPEPYPHLM